MSARGAMYGIHPRILKRIHFCTHEYVCVLAPMFSNSLHTMLFVYLLLTHTTAWDRLGEVRKLSSLGLKLHIDSSGSMTMMKLGSLMGCRLQNAGYLCLAQHFSGIGVTLNVFLSPLKYI